MTDEEIEKKADEFANGLMGLGTYSESWNHADKYMYNTIKRSYIAGSLGIQKAMKEESIRFAKFVMKSTCQDMNDDNRWMYDHDNDYIEIITDDQLYEKYLNSLK